MDSNPIDVIEESIFNLEELLVQFLELLPRLIGALVIFLVGLYVAGVISKLVRKAMTRREADLETTLLITQIARCSVITLVIVIALQQIGFNLTAFIAGLGIVGFTVGFALQDVSKNLIAGVILLLQQPFDIGDVIEVEGYVGVVENVDIRATQLRTSDGKEVLIPNGDVFTNPIINYSSDPKKRLDLTVGVAYGSDLELVGKTALDTIADVPGVLKEPVPQVGFNNFGESTIDFTLYFWVDTQKTSKLEAMDIAIKAINSAFEGKGIEMPYPRLQIVPFQD